MRLVWAAADAVGCMNLFRACVGVVYNRSFTFEFAVPAGAAFAMGFEGDLIWRFVGENVLVTLVLLPAPFDGVFPLPGGGTFGALVYP